MSDTYAKDLQHTIGMEYRAKYDSGKLKFCEAIKYSCMAFEKSYNTRSGNVITYTPDQLYNIFAQIISTQRRSANGHDHIHRDVVDLIEEKEESVERAQSTGEDDFDNQSADGSEHHNDNNDQQIVTEHTMKGEDYTPNHALLSQMIESKLLEREEMKQVEAARHRALWIAYFRSKLYQLVNFCIRIFLTLIALAALGLIILGAKVIFASPAEYAKLFEPSTQYIENCSKTS